ncbi:MAG TPA: type II toxin-antitoxin system VapC family toxin [Pyrinomonadaceae bacterium]|nr:type II toxin-antitoxin system VapC family toxin [Pyrinomonadaceae bacterium]
MMNNLLNTCTMSEFTKKLPNEKVIEWFSAQMDETLFLSAITIAEIQKGIEPMASSKKRNELENWLDSVIRRFNRRVLPFDLQIARRWAVLTATLEKKGRILPTMDSFILATALEHNLTIITRNEKDFADTGAKVLNIWE